MGCNECKKKQDQQDQQGVPESGSMTIPLMPKEIANGSFNGNILFKIVAFAAVVAVLPFIIFILLGQMFLTFFVPKSAIDITSKFLNFIKTIVEKYGVYKAKKMLKRREKEFNNTTSYDDYDVYETEGYSSPEEMLSDAENLEWVNLSNRKTNGDNIKK